MNNPNLSQQKEIELKLIQGAVNRASGVALFFAIAFVLFGFTVFEFISKFDDSISLWSNLWPRILFNGFPLLLVYFSFKNYKTKPVLKLWLWSIGFPIIFMIACLIHVWPLIWLGHSDLYLYVHGANGLVLILATTIVAPPPRYLILMLVTTTLVFILPLSTIFAINKEFFLLKFFLTDFTSCYFLISIGSQMNFKLRNKLATEDVMNKGKIEKFVGNLVSESIFENNESLIQPRQSNAFLMSIDVRNFTRFSKSTDPDLARVFKEKYHALVAKAVGDLGGFIHKTNGDGHLISMGLMTQEVDLTDVPGIEKQLKELELKKHQQLLARFVVLFENIFRKFEQLKDNMAIEEDICICASIDYGQIGLNLLGDPNVRLEFDIEGLIVIRCTRLEAYTKNLRKILSSNNSFLVLSDSASKLLAENHPFIIFETITNPINDFPDENRVYYKEFVRRKKRRIDVA